MGVNTKIIKRRIKSIGSTRKITKAMEMVSAAKMRKAVEAALKTRTYATLAWNLLVNLSITQKIKIPLLQVRPVKKLLVILITSNRGLCGSFNSNIIKKIAEQLKNPSNIAMQRVRGHELSIADKIKFDVIGIGKKGADFSKKAGYNIVAAYTDMPGTPRLRDITPVSQMIIKAYEQKKYDKVVIAYTDFKSTLVQTAKLRQVLPISELDLEKMITDMGKNTQPISEINAVELGDYIFEPSRDAVLEHVLPRLVEVQIYQSLLESAASEQSARMVAMRNASDSAKDMISDLSLIYNKARQAGITQEIAEIAGGAAALE